MGSGCLTHLLISQCVFLGALWPLGSFRTFLPKGATNRLECVKCVIGPGARAHRFTLYYWLSPSLTPAPTWTLPYIGTLRLGSNFICNFTNRDTRRRHMDYVTWPLSICPAGTLNDKSDPIRSNISLGEKPRKPTLSALPFHTPYLPSP